MTEDTQLLRKYAEEKSEDAFTELTQRHLSLVYHAALRRTNGNVHLAEDVTQRVFNTLSQKAASLSRHPSITGWLYTTTRFIANWTLREERRRSARQQAAHAMNSATASTLPVDWDRLRPVLDSAMDELSNMDQEAILLRFFDGHSFPEIGRLLKLNEDAVRKRVDRALDKLHTSLTGHGIESTAAALAVALTSQAGAAVPAGLGATVAGAALAGTAASGDATIFLTFMSATKTIIISAVAIVAIGSTLYEADKAHRAEAALDIVTRDRDNLAKNVVIERKENEQLKESAAALRHRSPSAAKTLSYPSTDPTKLQGLMRDPAYRKLQATTLRGQLDDRYAALFKVLALGPDQLAQLKNLLVERELATSDAAVATSEQGVTAGTDGRALRNAANSLDSEIETTLGDQVYGQLQKYDQTQPERDVVNQLHQALSYSATPLTDDQSNLLIQVFQQTAPTTPSGAPTTFSSHNLRTGLVTVGNLPYPITDQAVEAAQSILSTEQTAALRQIEIEQQAQEQIRQMTLTVVLPPTS